jgi:hypothetical protein
VLLKEWKKCSIENNTSNRRNEGRSYEAKLDTVLEEDKGLVEMEETLLPVVVVFTVVELFAVA